MIVKQGKLKAIIKLKLLAAPLLFLSTGILLNSCCSFCEIETVVEHTVDSIYYGDTIEVQVLNPINKENEELLQIKDQDLIYWSSLSDSISRELDSLYKTLMTAKNFTDAVYSDTSSIYGTFSESYAWVDSSKLKHILIEDSTLTVRYDSLLLVINDNQNTIVNVKDKNDNLRDKLKRYRRISWALGIILGIILFMLFRKYFIEYSNK